MGACNKQVSPSWLSNLYKVLWFVTIFPQANRGRGLRAERVKRDRLMTRLVRCKEGMLRTENVNKNAFKLLTQRNPKQMEQKSSY